ncbi:hypothetical protein GCM10007874_45240 [Labrys miyagiensis]|uniref:Uncharacterized protein n=1 Tax=Labrys miyagiensis TaxID=346912 RepID=A0ABQ6CTC2_9HYPH|nr:hypothetical protein [Labrys miyagiensis]GLS21507.1 hypothetical protein GCM10007874_45240 [Labrys miyagiensis]
MSTDTFYANVTFVRDAHNELVALNPLAMPTLYRALREASFSIGKETNEGRIVGAVVFSRDVDDVSSSKGVAVAARFGDTPAGG